MPPSDWLLIPVITVTVYDLTPTQDILFIDRIIALAEGGKRLSDDPYGHVIAFNGQLYILNGHHYWAMHWLYGITDIKVRVKQIDTPCREPCHCHEELVDGYHH